MKEEKFFLKDGEVCRTCTKCGEDKPLKTSFYLQKKDDGRISFGARCKACCSVYNAERYDPKKKRIQSRKYYKNNKQYFKEYWAKEENKEKRKLHNKVYQLKDSLGGEKLDRGERARRKNERYDR